MIWRLIQAVKNVIALAIATRGANTYNGTAIDTLGFDSAHFDIFVGTLATGSTLNVKIEESNATGSGWGDIAGAAITQMTEAGGDSDKVATIDVRLGGRANRKRYVRATAVVATANATFGVLGKLYSAETAPVTNTPTPVTV